MVGGGLAVPAWGGWRTEVRGITVPVWGDRRMVVGELSVPVWGGMEQKDEGVF